MACGIVKQSGITPSVAIMADSVAALRIARYQALVTAYVLAYQWCDTVACDAGCDHRLVSRPLLTNKGETVVPIDQFLFLATSTFEWKGRVECSKPIPGVKQEPDSLPGGWTVRTTMELKDLLAEFLPA